MVLNTKEYHDEFWPKNISAFELTRLCMLTTVSERHANHALDEGCGHGLYSVVLPEIVDRLTRNGFESPCIQDWPDRMKSATISVTRWVKVQESIAENGPGGR